MGKMATAVPVLMSRALELFIADLVSGSCNRIQPPALNSDNEQDEQSRRNTHLTPSHLKACIEEDPMFDFLKPIVESVAVESQEPRKIRRTPKPRKAANTTTAEINIEEMGESMSAPTSAPVSASASKSPNVKNLLSDDDNEDDDTGVALNDTVVVDQPTQLVLPAKRTISDSKEEDYDCF